MAGEEKTTVRISPLWDSPSDNLIFLEGTENQEAEDGPSEEPARGRLHVPGGRPSQASLVATWSGLGFSSRGWGGPRRSGDGSRVGDVLEAEAGR